MWFVFFPTDDFLNRLGAIVIRLNVILPLGRSVDASIGTAADFPLIFFLSSGRLKKKIHEFVFLEFHVRLANS